MVRSFDLTTNTEGRAIICTLDNVRPRPSTQEILLHLAVPMEHAGLVSGFLTKLGQQFGVAFSEVGATKPPETYGEQARILRQSGVFRSPAMWRLAGTDREWQEWCRGHPCAVCGSTNDIEYAHFRHTDASVDGRTSPSSANQKPEYCGHPMCRRCHLLQHQRGYEALRGLPQGDPIQTLQRQRVALLEEWSWGRIKEKLGYAHWNEVPPNEFRDWLANTGADVRLPARYVEG